MSREEKLNIISKNGSIKNINWKKIIPDNNNDWVNIRDDNYLRYSSLFTKKDFDIKSKDYFTNTAVGLVSSRDPWVYSFSKDKLINNVKLLINKYNEDMDLYNGDLNLINKDATKISWSRALKNRFKNCTKIKYDSKNIVVANYRPFCKQYLYYDNNLIESPGKSKKMFCNENLVISLSGLGGNKPFSCIITNTYTDFNMLEAGAHLYGFCWYEEEKQDLISSENKFIKYDGISDYISDVINKKYLTEITKADIFYYVYGVLHSRDYREKFSADLKKSLPRIPLVDTYDDFKLFSNAGKELAKLHLEYEKITPYKKCSIRNSGDDYKVTKMKFGKNKDKSIIEYNDKIVISNIPEKAYDYIVNGKSAIEWVMERYSIATDKKSGIVNDPNDWCKEVNDEKYIFNLLLRVINVSVKTIKIIESLPKLNFEE